MASQSTVEEPSKNDCVVSAVESNIKYRLIFDWEADLVNLYDAESICSPLFKAPDEANDDTARWMIKAKRVIRDDKWMGFSVHVMLAVSKDCFGLTDIQRQAHYELSVIVVQANGEENYPIRTFSCPNSSGQIFKTHNKGCPGGFESSECLPWSGMMRAIALWEGKSNVIKIRCKLTIFENTA